MIFEKKEQIEKFSNIFEIDKKIKKQIYQVSWDVDKYNSWKNKNYRVSNEIKFFLCRTYKYAGITRTTFCEKIYKINNYNDFLRVYDIAFGDDSQKRFFVKLIKLDLEKL